MALANGTGGDGVTAVARPYYTTGQRILRGYGPVVALILVLVLIAVLVPSKAQKATNAAAVGASESSDQSAGVPGANAAGGPTGGPAAGPQGSAGQAGTAGKNVTLPGKTTACTSQALQVPGDPYSPPCIQFSGDNGGATSKGVAGDTITVAVRLTSDQSFQQTLAQLAGAQLRDTNDDNVRTIKALADYFNTHYQFYGRKIKIVTYNGQGSLSNELQGNGQAAAQADAVSVGKQINAFADITGESEPYATSLKNQ